MIQSGITFVNESESKSVIQMDTSATKVNENENSSSNNDDEGTENTSESSKKKDGESGNVHNNVLNFYECDEKICHLTYE